MSSLRRPYSASVKATPMRHRATNFERYDSKLKNLRISKFSLTKLSDRLSGSVKQKTVTNKARFIYTFCYENFIIDVKFSFASPYR